MSEFLNKNSCINCKYFCRYYVKHKEEFKPVSCGFCTNEEIPLSERNKKMLDLCACNNLKANIEQ